MAATSCYRSSSRCHEGHRGTSAGHDRERLVRELTRLTGTPSTCYFALWEGCSTIIATTTAAAESLVACEGLEALLVPSDGRLDLGGDKINVG